MIIAIDGPSGSGKSSVSTAVARALQLSYLDTGAMYRAVAWAMLERGIDVSDVDAITKACETVDVRPSVDPDHPGIYVGTQDVSVAIRTPEVTAAVSAVSAVPRVRELMVALQRELAGSASRGIVVEGRDIASVVLPQADLKLFLTADPDARAARRTAEAGGQVERTREKLLERDRADSTRAASPFRQSDDALELDTTHMDLEEVVDAVLELARNQ
jgi:cytidylate kinase